MMAMDYAMGAARISDIEIHTLDSTREERRIITGLTVEGQLVIPTNEFFNRLFAEFGLNEGWAAKKSYARRFQWLQKHYSDAEVRYCIEWDELGNSIVHFVRARKPRQQPAASVSRTSRSKASDGWRRLIDAVKSRAGMTSVLSPPGEEVALSPSARVLLDGPEGTPKPSVN